MKPWLRLVRQFLPDSMRPVARSVRAWLRGSDASSYQARIDQERAIFDGQEVIHDLPAIFHYWSNKHLRPLFEAHGFSHPEDFFAKRLLRAVRQANGTPMKFLSVGAGNCDVEITVAGMLKAAGVHDFSIECLELSEPMLARGKQHAEQLGLGQQLCFLRADFNGWRPQSGYHGIIANQSLHHVLALEHLFDAIKQALLPGAEFLVSDMIGRNGHMRWPEALCVVQQFWQLLPRHYRYNLQLKRFEARYRNFDCSIDNFEGIRAQEVLPELLKRFHFSLFIACSNVVDVFIDRGFGPHFDPASAWDRDFIDSLHAFDEHALASGLLTPTRLLGALSVGRVKLVSARELEPTKCVRIDQMSSRQTRRVRDSN